MDFNKVTQEELKKVQDQLSRRPRKISGRNKPHEDFTKLLNIKSVQ